VDADRLILDFALVMVLLLIAPLLSLRLRLPDIAGIIVAGVIVGEHGLGLFNLDQTFQLLGKVGLLYLMFLAGLEINLNDFQRYKKPGLVFGTLTFLIPQVLGALGAHWWLGFTWPQAILLASMFASHTLIPFPIIQRFGLGRNRAVTTTIGGTILTDTAALLVLAVIVKSGGDGVGPAFWIRLGLSLAALVFGSIVLLPRLGYWFFRRAAPDGAAEFIFVLAATFLVAYAAELAGVEPIIGAFLAGLALSPVVPGRGVLMSRLHFVGYALFIPFFLLSVGMRVNLRVLFTGLDGWLVALYMVGGVTACKWMAAKLSGRILGYTRDETGLLFGLSVNQAAATLAAVLVGVRVGIFGDAVLNGTILMILVTCLIGPWITEKCARRMAEGEELQPSAPRHESGRILIPLVSPLHVDAITDLALMLRPDRCEEPIYPLHVAFTGPDDPDRVAEAERLLGGAVARAEAAGVHAIPLARLDSSVAGGILNAAVEFRACAIVMGWHPRTRVASLLQSIPDRVITQSTQAVLVYRTGLKLSTTKRLWVLAPPLIEHHAGLPNALQLARRIATHASAQVLLAATDKTRKAIDSLPGKRPATGSSKIPSLPAWGDVLREFSDAVAEGDALLLLSVRRGHLAWQPSLERLPIDWAQRWPQANLMVMFPPLLSGDTDEEDAMDAASPEEKPVRPLPPMVTVRIATEDLDKALRELLHGVLADQRADVGPLAAQLRRSPPVPLSDQVALLHLHTPLVDTARIAVGIRPEGFALDGFDVPPGELVLLLSPRAGTPEQHLRILAAITRAVRQGGLAPTPS
jgi:Kef-type K+ transport system membrane component KefB/nucleotide-binding universal stress UspA family protein